MKHSTQLNRRDYTAQKAAQNAWNALCSNPAGDVEGAVKQYMAEHPGLKPGAFRHSSRKQTRLAWEQFRGRNGKGAALGRLRALEDEPLEFRRVGLSEVELSDLETDLFTQFEPGLIKICFDALHEHVECPFWTVLERGRVKGRNHFHVLVKPGTCKLGVSNGIVPDSELVGRVAYLLKPPIWNLENAVAYLTVKHARAGKDVASRISSRGLGNARTQVVTLADIELALGFRLAAPSGETFKAKKERDQVAPLSTSPNLGRRDKLTQPAKDTFPNLGRREKTKSVISNLGRQGVETPLPELRHSDSDCLEFVGRLHAVWAQGFFDGKPGQIGAGRTADLGAALNYYFNRTWLSSGETDDLKRLAQALDLYPMKPLYTFSATQYQGAA